MRGKGFNIDSIPFYKWRCVVCSKEYYKSGSHARCYRRYCSICSWSFTKDDYLKNHALEWHPNDFCSRCNDVFEDKLDIHIQNNHTEKILTGGVKRMKIK